jgi:hypothetical protein
MSYTTIKAIWPGEKHEDLEELRNSHGSAPVIWGELSRRFLGNEYTWLHDPKKLWPLYKREDVPTCMRACLMMTFDRAYVEKKDYARAAADIREFLRMAPPKPGYANHWPRLAELFESNPDIPAIGLYCTSVGEDPFQGPYNEEKEDYDAPDWSTCWSVYDDEYMSPAKTEGR